MGAISSGDPRPEEIFAQAIVEELRPDLTLVFNHSQSNGEPDFQVLDSVGKAIGVLEVTTICDELRVEETHLLHGKKRFARVSRALCSRAWIVTIAEGVPLKPLRAKLDSLLNEAEVLGLESLTRGDDRAYELYSRLRTISGNGRAIVHDYGPHHHLTQEAYAFFTNENSVNDALIELFKRTDNMRKLTSNSSLPERHLFVRVHLSAMQACDQLMSSDVLPDSELPDYITDLWLVPTHISTDSTLAVWHVSNGSGWQRLTVANGFIPRRRSSA